MKLYAISYFGLDNEDGRELFSHCYYYSDSAKAKAKIVELANSTYKQTLSSCLYPSRIDLYTQLRVYADNDGVFQLMRHGVVSYSDGNAENNEEVEDRKVVINTDSELFRTL